MALISRVIDSDIWINNIYFDSNNDMYRCGNLGVHDMNIDNEIIDGLPVYSSASTMGGLRENDSNPWARDMNTDNKKIACPPVCSAVSTTKGSRENDSNLG